MADLFLVPKKENTTSNTQPPDWQARKEALDVKQSWIVEAPAGSGKTGLLIQRYLKLLADESVDQPEQVLAITFTVKATTEIRDRVIAQLQSATGPDRSKTDFDRETRSLAEAVLRRDALLGWELLEHPHRLKMQTIHSVCAEIARSLPVLSGGVGGISPVEDSTPRYREAARQTLMQFGGKDAALNEALRTVLLHRDGNFAECERLLAEMLSLRDQWGALVPLTGVELNDAYLDGTVLPQLQRTLEQAICKGLAALEQGLPTGLLQKLTKLAAEMATLEGYNGNPSPIAICGGRHASPEATAAHLAHWRALMHLLVSPSQQNWRRGFNKNHIGFNATPKERALLKPLVESLQPNDGLLDTIRRIANLPPSEYPQEQWLVAKALFRVLSRALAELQLVFAERGECDFAELGLLAKAALQSDGAIDDLATALGMKLQHLLVDEMQDTSTSQYELIELLTQGWDGRSQTVFLVGDPKQSIYLFRQARVERFIRTMLAGQLGELPLGRLRLTANFRSQAGLVDGFNQDFSLLFPPETSAASPEDVPYVEAAPVRVSTNSGAPSAQWHSSMQPSGIPAEDANILRREQAKLDAWKVRTIVEQWRAKELPEERRKAEGREEKPWKIAVLVRSRNLLIDIVAALKKNDGNGAIPFRAVEIEALGERREVLDLFALTRALLHPADRVAWLAMLHAPWCGLGLAELHILAGADDPMWEKRSMEDIVAERGHLLSEESCVRLARLWSVFQAAAARRSRLTAAQRVERTWRSLGGDAYLQPDEMANARRYLQLLDEAEGQSGTIDLSLLKQRLDKLFAQPNVSAGAVDLMTIHGAKGLEWDVVIIPGLEKKTRSNNNRLLTWDEIDSADDATAHIVLAPIAGKGEASKELNVWLSSIHAAREEAERKRLFYVVCTRAREELHLFASPELKANGEINLPAGSLLKTAWPAAERHFAHAIPAQGAATKTLVMPPVASAKEELIVDIAASAKEVARHPMLQRLPLAFDPQTQFVPAEKLAGVNTETQSETAHFERPEGSLEARAFGRAVHLFLEMLANHLSEGIAVDALLRELAGWGPRIAAVLRGNGLPPTMLEARTQQVKTALRNSLQDAEGRWILAARDEAATEHALTSWTDQRRSVRLDRVFRAGAAALAAGRNCLWIVDYKTTTHGSEGIEKFLEEERAKYEPQMEAYARIAKTDAAAANIRVALYYPLLPKLIWWTPALA